MIASVYLPRYQYQWELKLNLIGIVEYTGALMVNDDKDKDTTSGHAWAYFFTTQNI